MLRGLLAAASCAAAGVIPECTNGKRRGCNARKPPTAAAAIVAQANTASFMIAPWRRITNSAMVFSPVFPLFVPRSMWRQLSCDRRLSCFAQAKAANEAGAQAPTRKIRLGEVVREARARGPRVD